MGAHRKPASRRTTQVKRYLIALAAAISLFFAVHLAAGGPSMSDNISGPPDASSSSGYSYIMLFEREKEMMGEQQQQAMLRNYHPRPPQPRWEKAVDFAYAQLGCPYVWGGVGPCNQGYDCSGLVQQAWAYAGVYIPRTTWEQWAQLQKVPVSAMRPGDLLIMFGGDHVGMYVGGGWMIDAPQPGLNVQRIPVDGWPMQNLVAVVRP